MIDRTRLEGALVAVARRYAAHLVPVEWARAGDYSAPLPELARALSEHGILVLGAHSADANALRAWVDAYLALYNRLAARLFPSFTGVNAFYIDQTPPPLVGFQGAALPVIMALGGYTAPFVAAHAQRSPSEVELRGLLDLMLDELEAGDLPRDDYRALRDAGVEALRTLTTSPVRTESIMTPARPILADVGAAAAPPPPDLPESAPAASTPPPPPSFPEEFSPPSGTPKPPPPPPHLPETRPQPPDTESPFKPDAVPVFFDPKRRPGDTGRLRPPVPPLPEE